MSHNLTEPLVITVDPEGVYISPSIDDQEAQEKSDAAFERAMQAAEAESERQRGQIEKVHPDLRHLVAASMPRIRWPEPGCRHLEFDEVERRCKGCGAYARELIADGWRRGDV